MKGTLGTRLIARVAFVLALAFGSAMGQTLESTILLPDSYGRLVAASTMAIDVPGNRVFLGGWNNDRILIVDGGTNQVTGSVAVKAGSGPYNSYYDMCYNPTDHKLYCRVGFGESYLIIAPDSCRVIREFNVYSRSASGVITLLWDSLNDRVYWLTQGDTVVGVMDGKTDSLYATQFTGEPWHVSWYDTIARNRQGYQCRTISVARAVITGGEQRDINNKVTRLNNPCTGRTYEISDHAYDELVVRQSSNGSVLARVRLSFDSDWCYAASHDRLYCPSRDQLAVVDPAKARVERLLPIGGDFQSSCYSDRHDRVYLADYANGQVVFFDPQSGSVAKRITIGGHPDCLLYDCTFDRLWCIDDHAGSLTTMDGRTGRVLAQTSIGSYLNGGASLCLDSLDGKVYCPVGGDSTLLVLDAKSGRAISRLKLPAAPSAMCFDHKDRKLYVGLPGDTTRIAVFDTRTDSLVKTVFIAAEDGWPVIYDLCYGANLNRVYCCAQWDETVIIDCTLDSVVGTIYLCSQPAMLYDPRRSRLYASDYAPRGNHDLWVYDETTGKTRQVPGVDYYAGLPESDGKGRLFVDGPSRIYILRDE